MTDADRRSDEPGTVPEDPWPHSSYPPLEQPASPSHPRFPWWMALIAAATAVLAAASFVVVLAWPSPSDDDPAASAGSLAFQPRELVASISFDQPTDHAFSRIVGDRAYLAWQRGGDLEVIALAVATGEQDWTHRIPGDSERSWGDLLATPEIVAAIGYPPDPPDSSDSSDSSEEDEEPEPAALPMAVLSAATGQPLWNDEIHEYDQVWAGSGALVLVDRVRGAVRGLATDTGDELWQVPFPGGTGAEVKVVPVLTAEHLAGSSTLTGAPVGPPYHRLVLVGEDLSAQLIDVHDGTVAGAGTNVADPDDLLLAYEDRLYVAFSDSGYRVDARDLADLSSRPQTIYVTPDPRRLPTDLSPCGAGRLCLLDRVDWEWDTAQVRAVDLAADATGDPQLWNGDVPQADQLVPVGDWLLVAGDGGGSPLAGYDRDGRSVISQPEGIAVRLDASSLLVFATGPYWGNQDLSVAGLRVDGDGDRVELGQLPRVHGAACSWNASYLVCPGSENAGIWRFTG